MVALIVPLPSQQGVCITRRRRFGVSIGIVFFWNFLVRRFLVSESYPIYLHFSRHFANLVS